MKGKEHQNLLLTEKKAKNAYPTKVRTLVIKSNTASRVLKENSTSEELSQNV